MFMDGDQVIGFPPRFRETLLEEFIEGFQVFKSPILSGSHFTEILAQFDEALVAFVLFGLFPGQDLINLPQDQERSLAIEFRSHKGPRVNPQVRPASQGSSLLVGESVSNPQAADHPGRAPDGSSSHIRSEEIEYRCAEGNVPPRSGRP